MNTCCWYGAYMYPFWNTATINIAAPPELSSHTIATSLSEGLSSMPQSIDGSFPDPPSSGLPLFATLQVTPLSVLISYQTRPKLSYTRCRVPSIVLPNFLWLLFAKAEVVLLRCVPL